MVYLSDFGDFETAAQELFKTQPLRSRTLRLRVVSWRTRYLVKYRHKEGKAGVGLLLQSLWGRSCSR